MYYKVINLEGDTFGDPLFHKALQNQPFSLVQKGTFLSEYTDVFVITPSRQTFFFPETKNLNFGGWKLLRNWKFLEVWKLKGSEGQEACLWLARAALKITKIQIFSFREEKCSSIWSDRLSTCLAPSLAGTLHYIKE